MFDEGDTVTVPKGTLILDGMLDYANQGTVAESKRASLVKITETKDMSHYWWKFISEANQKRVDAVYKGYWMNAFEGSFFSAPFGRQPEPLPDDLVAEIKAETDAVWGDYQFVSWSNDKKHCLASAVVAAEAPAPKAPKEAAITKRRLMVEGSVWRFTADFDVMVKIHNPAIDPLTKERESYRVDRNRSYNQGGTHVVVLGGGREQTQAELDAMARIQAQIDALPPKIEILGAKVKAGTRVKLIGKPKAEHTYSRNPDSLGLLVPMMVIDGPSIGVAKQLLEGHRYHNPLHHGGGIKLPYSIIEKNIEAESVPEDIVWVLRDSATGEYFGGWLTEKDRGYRRSADRPKMSETFSGSKKYKNLSAVKASIMDFTGYMSGIEEEGYRPDWVGSETKKMELPDKWEAVAIDKTTNTEKRTEDVQSWYANLMRLKVLTVEYGSAVRTVYKKIEAKKDEYQAIVVFKTPERWEELEDREKRQIAEAMENTEGKPISAKNEAAQAYAVKSQIDATMIMLAYSGTATVKAFDVENLKEIVPDA